MTYLNLTQHLVKNINMRVNITEHRELRMLNRYSFKVNYSDDLSTCTANLWYETYCESDPEILTITVEMSGIFSCEDVNTTEDKQLAHTQAYGLLFPYAQSLIAYLTVQAGLAPLMIEMARIEPKTVSFTE